MLKNAIKYAKQNLCSVYLYDDGTYSEHKFDFPIGVIEYYGKEGFLVIWYQKVRGEKIAL